MEFELPAVHLADSCRLNVAELGQVRCQILAGRHSRLFTAAKGETQSPGRASYGMGAETHHLIQTGQEIDLLFDESYLPAILIT